VRIDTRPVIRIAWPTRAGTQTARSGGTTQVPCSVVTVITPLDA
jgi:hypothetical protein